MAERELGTSGEVELTEALVAKLAEEAERGYESSRLRTRTRRGRPPIGSEAATVFQVRLEASLREALERAADAEETTPSDIARRALRAYLNELSDRSAPNPAESGGVHEFPLSFATVECPGCRIERVAGIHCPKCGHGPETDPNVERRKAVLARAIRLLGEDLTGTGKELHFDSRLLGQLSKWLTSLMEMCAEAAKGHDVAEALVEHIAQLRQWERDSAATDQYRPFLWYWKLIADIVAQLRAIAHAYFEALTSASPEQAEGFGKEAQERIDHAGSVAETAARRLDRWHTIEESADHDDPMAVLIAIAQADAEERGHGNLLTVDPVSEALYERVTGNRNCPPWLALSLRLTDIQVDPLLDRTRFWDCAALTHRRVTTKTKKGKAALADVTRSPNWIPDLQGIHDELFEIGCELRALAKRFDRPKAVARTLIRFGHQLAERCAPALLATVLAAYRERSYEDLRAKDIGALLSEAEDVGLNALLFGIDGALRHADAHKLFALDADGVTFTADKREYDHLSWDQLSDRVLGGWESVLALVTGILCAADSIGVPFEELDPLTYLDAPPESKLKVILAEIGWRDVTVQRDSEKLSIQARADQQPKRLSFVVYLAAYIPDGVDLSVTIDAEGEQHSWAGPTRGLEVFGTSASEEHKQAAILQLLATWTMDGERLTSQAQLRKLAAVNVLQWTVADTSVDTRSQNVRMILDVANATQDDKLANVVIAVLRGLDLIATGNAPRDWERTVTQLSKWAEVEVPAPAIFRAEDTQ